jgi:energy-coupling factor transporter ATP-binding protein EcfA2
MPPILIAQNITKRFGATPLVDNLSFAVHDGDRIGLIGPNGAGKSTLLAILGAEQEPDSGEVSFRKRARIGYVHQLSDFPPGITVRQIAEATLNRVAVAASYDDTLRHGAQTPFNDQLTFRWEGGMWEYDAMHDSIVAAGNGGAQPVQARFTIFYNRGTQRYDLEQPIQPDDEMWVDIGQLIRNQVPDKNGSVLPSTLTNGSYEITDLSHHGAGTIFEGKVIYDKTNGDAAYGCAACCGHGEQATLWYDPLGILDGSDAFQGVQAPDMCAGGVITDISDPFYGYWSVQNTGIATVDYYGTHTAVTVGSTRSNTSGSYNNNDARRGCPDYQAQPSGQDNVTPTVTISGPSNVPVAASGTVNTIQLTATGNPTGGTYQWSTSSSAVQLTNTSNATVTVTGQSGGTASITVTYTLNEQSGSASQTVTAQQPTSIASSFSPSSVSCLTVFPGLGLNYSTSQVFINYTVNDQNGNPIQFQGIPTNESFSAISNNCGGVPNTPNPKPSSTNSAGGFNDTQVMCSSSCLPANGSGQPTGSCTLQVSQNITANGYSVQAKTITYTCIGPPTVE